MLHIINLNKIYGGKVSYQALSDINLSIGQGEFVGVMGPSGIGKTTLLNMVSTIDKKGTTQWISDKKIKRLCHN